VQWADVIRPPSQKTLRQFAGLWLVVFLGMAAARWWRGQADSWAVALAIVAIVVGLAGLIAPAVVRPIYTGWMVAAFPIGWTVSRIVLGAIFFGVLTPIAASFRGAGRDQLRLRRRSQDTYWLPKRKPAGAGEYFRQS
jgi:Saxitoxin biosynthesis operon protein SxtJ